jgi:uncharacterized membrane protein
MLPEPLHPALVHFPLVLSLLLPISAAVALWAIARGASTRRTWAVPLVLSVALVGSGWAALETGQHEEDRVEEIVGEAAIHDHEEAAERFMVFAGVALLITATGIAGGTLGRGARIVAIAASLVVAITAVQVGAAGGELVYQKGAARAYVDGTQRGTLESPPGTSSDDERGEREEREERERH